MFENFTGKYKLTKTLRFGLIPQGETLKNIEENGILEEDFVRAREKKNAQKLADEYHKAYIDETLLSLSLNENDLREFSSIYTNSDLGYQEYKERMNAASEKLRLQISDAMTKKDGFEDMFKGKMFSEILPEIYKNDASAMGTLACFEGFTSYFVPYHKNRRLLYSSEDKHGSIGKRLINDNLPIYIDNIAAAERILSALPSLKESVEKDLKGILSESLTDLFSLENYSTFLTQFEIDRYNTIIGGYIAEDGSKVRGINEHISMHNHTIKDNRLPFLKKLKKQMLSDAVSFSFSPDPFISDEEVLNAVFEFDKAIVSAESDIFNVLSNIGDYNSSGIYIKASELNTLSDKIFGSWRHIEGLLSERYDANAGISKKTRKYEEEKKKHFKNARAYSLSELDMLPGIDGKISEYIKGASGFHKITIAEARKDLEKKAKLIEDRSLKRNSSAKAAIKGHLDAVTELRRFVSILVADSSDKDGSFYSEIEPAYDILSGVTGLYNKTRNYLSGKLYTNEKVKLNFGSAVLLDGWSESVEKVKLGTILLKDGHYYLGIIAKGQGDLFAKIPEAETGEVYQKMRYNLISGANKSLPHVVFSKKGIETFKPDEEIMRIYKSGSFKKGKDFSLDDCHRLIDFYKECIAQIPSWKCFDFKFSDTSSYEDISGFFHEVENGGYSMEFRGIDSEIIDSLVKEGRLYLFEIWNKDFSEHSHGKPDLSTIYWRALFDPRNKESLTYKLNGGAEVFFRKASIKEKDIIRHKAGDIVNAKNPRTKNKSRKLEYDIIKDRRFTVDKFQLNVPITLNASAADFFNINAEARLAIKKAEDPHVIGVSRGEKSLIHITVLDSKGEVVEQRSLNVIGNTDYAELLARREAARDAERKSWESVEGIKQLKEGYIGNVVRVLSDLMIKYDAILAVEDLDARFKNDRQKIEKAVYQQLEEKLIRKLNFLVNKDAEEGDLGEPFMAYQLTGGFQGAEKIGRQTGFIFYVSPWNTTAIDSKAGFVNLFDTRYKSVAASQEFWRKFDKISYDEEIGAYRFDFDYMNFVSEERKKVLSGTNTDWSIYSRGERIQSVKTDKGVKHQRVLLEDEINILFEEYDVGNSDNLVEDICTIHDKDFHERLMNIFGMTVNLRCGGEILSPVIGKDGTFFTAMLDANGSYNIARKGLMLVQRIKDAEDAAILAGGKGGISLNIMSNEWLSSVQKQISMIQ